ncbi:hypothetical protein F0U62_24570 [Cystobacter fuscus]|uniref:hypothetical protein n=1 Tax=Cystobacter fuscus TaxID=43 RepID=UPI002B2E0C3E|nr:hypothetical protein F0U62_24570 [Cystobacter fuscus]
MRRKLLAFLCASMAVLGCGSEQPLSQVPRVPVAPPEGMKTLSASAALISPLAANNHDASQAIPINLETVYSDYVTAVGQEDWYYVYTPSAGKLTALMSPPNDATIDYDLSVFSLNASTGYLENQLDSMYGPGSTEQLSLSASAGGYYFIRVTSYAGSSATAPFYLLATFSPNPDSAEPDDNVTQARAVSGLPTLQRTIDNVYDQDWVAYQVTTQTNLRVRLDGQTAGSTFFLDIFNSNLASMGRGSQGSTYSLSLAPGTYYFRVASSSGTGSYTLSLSPSVASRIGTLSYIQPCWASDAHPVNYGYGMRFRAKEGCELIVTGQAFDSNQQAASFARVSVVFQTEGITNISRKDVVADVFGYFTASVLVPYGYGLHYYDNWVSGHYWDWGYVDVYSTDTAALLGSDSIYAFSYQLYQPH